MMEAMRSLLDPKADCGRGRLAAPRARTECRRQPAGLRLHWRDFRGESALPGRSGLSSAFPSVSDLPASVDCLVVAVAADATCDILEEAYAHGIPAAIVLAAGFGEGGHGDARAARLRSLADQGMCICGPNCFGLINVKAGVRGL